MEIMLIHFTGTSGLLCNRNVLNSTKFRVQIFFFVHVPDRKDKVSEVSISLNLRVNNSVPFLEVIKGHSGVIPETLVGTVQRCKKILELKPCLVHIFETFKHVRVAERVKLRLNLVKGKPPVFIGIKVPESFKYQFLSLCVDIIIQIIKEGLVIDLVVF